MRRSSVRFFAFAIVLFLGAPVAMHVVIHDLHAGEEHHGAPDQSNPGHGDHEHPVVSSPQLQVPILTQSFDAPVVVDVVLAECTRVATMARSVMTHGAVRLDNDVGLQPFLSTFLI